MVLGRARLPVKPFGLTELSVIGSNLSAKRPRCPTEPTLYILLEHRAIPLIIW
jgi:hypothetical protein